MVWEILLKGVVGTAVFTGVFVFTSTANQVDSIASAGLISIHEGLIGKSISVSEPPGDKFNLIILPDCNSCQASSINWSCLADDLRDSSLPSVWNGGHEYTEKIKDLTAHLRQRKVALPRRIKAAAFPPGIYMLARRNKGDHAGFMVIQALPLPTRTLGGLQR